ncbi:MAG: glutathione S-transferase family protein, partial [Solirubrobacterales bacterium]|nr:glutathione S-transferase family protein [Solirubrobacterales bacterium]
MLLYNSQVSGNCYKVRLLFAHLGVQYERREVDVIDRSRRRELLGDLNPALRVPTLVLDDGRALAESNAILCYFAEGTPYLPAERFERAQVLQWLFFEQYSHEPYIAVARFWRIAGIKPAPEELQGKLRTGHAALAALDEHL